jgi:hypothetical protein
MRGGWARRGVHSRAARLSVELDPSRAGGETRRDGSRAPLPSIRAERLIVVALVALAVIAGSAALVAQSQPLAPPAVPAPAPRAAAPIVPPPAFPVEVALAPASERAGEVAVGDRVEVILTIKLPGTRLAGPPRFPVWGDTWGDVEILDKAPAQKVADQGGAAVYRQRLVVTPWKTGRLALPPAVVAVPLVERTVEARTPSDLALDVVSVLPHPKPGEAPPGPKGPAPMVPLPIGSRFWWTAGGLAAACAAAGALLAWRRRRALAEASGALALPPYEALLAELGRLSSALQAGSQAGDSSLPVHTGLSRALRVYLGRTLAFPAAESTTSEIQRQLTSRHLPSGLPRRTVEILRGCDLVKFARQEVGRERIRERLDATRALASEVEIYVHPPEEEAVDGATPLAPSSQRSDPTARSARPPLERAG